MNVYSGIKQTNEVQIWVAQIFGASKAKILFKVALPSSLPYLFTGLKVSLSMAWLGIVAAELSRSGNCWNVYNRINRGSLNDYIRNY